MAKNSEEEIRRKDLIVWRKVDLEESVAMLWSSARKLRLHDRAMSYSSYCGAHFEAFRLTNSIKSKRLINNQYLQIIQMVIIQDGLQ